jgi:hypothetical protein
MATIKLPNFIKKQPLALGCAFVCLALAAAIYFRKDTLAQAQADLEDQATQGKHLAENVTDANKLDEQLTAISEASQAIEERLVNPDRIPINQGYFYEIGLATQTKITVLQQGAVSKTVGRAAYIRVNYTIDVTGTYPQLLDFLRRVENGEHFSHVISLTLGNGGETSSKTTNPLLALTLSLELLGLPPSPQ